MSLTIIGRDPSDAVWVDMDGDTFPLSPSELMDMRSEVMRSPLTRRAGHAFDEMDVDALIYALVKIDGWDLEPCRHCGDPAPFQTPDGWICLEHMDALSNAENEQVESERAS